MSANLYTVSQKLPTFELSVTLSNLNRFSEFLHCTAGKRMKFATKLIWHYPPHLRHVATLAWVIKNSQPFPKITLGRLVFDIETLRCAGVRNGRANWISRINTQRHRTGRNVQRGKFLPQPTRLCLCFVCLLVCLSVERITRKLWMKCRVYLYIRIILYSYIFVFIC